jgi:hypothetical protein
MLNLALQNPIDMDEKDMSLQHFPEQEGDEATRNLSTEFMQEISMTLDKFINDQKKDIARTDSSFLTLGQDMQVLYGKTTELTGKIHGSATIISGNEEEGVLSRLGQSITGALAELKTRQDEVNSNLQQVAMVSKGMNDFHAMCPTLEQIAKFLRIIGLNICVECAQSPEASSLFMTNAEEIKNFAEDVIQINKDIRDDSQQTRDVLVSLHKNISTSLTRIQNLSSNAAQIVEEAFFKIQQLMDLSLAAMDQASTHSGKISGQVGEIVMAIQFHDNMSQRIEHIHTALHEASYRCSAEDKSKSDTDDMVERLAEVHAITVIQAGQIKEVIGGIEDVFQSNRQAFAEIGNEVAGLAEILISLTAGGEQPQASFKGKQQEDSFTTLQSALHELRQLLDYGTEQMGLIQEANTEASDTAVRLENHIDLLRRISDDTHIKALNSIILAHHLGPSGRTIEILAKEIKEIAIQSNCFVTDVEKVYQVVSKAITTLQISSGEKTAPADTHSVLLHTNIQDTTTAYHNFVNDSRAALEFAHDLDTEITQISDGLDFLPTLAEVLRDNLTILDRLTEQLSPWAGQMSAEARAEAARMADRYTMDEERVIHQQVFGETEDSGSKDIEMFGDDSDDMDIEMFGDDSDDMDIEMFDQDPEPSDFEMFEEESAPLQEEGLDQELGNNDAEEEKSSRKKSSPPHAAQTKNVTVDEALGDNFELF